MRQTLRSLVVLSCLIAFSIPAQAQKAPNVGTIQGTGIDLMTQDFSFAGRIKGSLALGAFDEASDTSDLSLRHEDQTIQATFSYDSYTGKREGNLSHTDANGVYHDTHIAFVDFDPEKKVFNFEINEQPVAVQVSSEGFVDEQFINPTYRTEWDGQVLEFTLKGSASYGYTEHLNMMILGAFFHK